MIESWTLLGPDWTLVGNKTGATRLGFALLLKFFEIEARFPRGADELPPVAVEYVAGQVKVAVAALAAYPWSGRSIKYHREQIRAAFGFREFTRGDEDKLAPWLAEEVCPVELRGPQLREAVLVRCRAERIEPPGRMDRIVGSARAAFEQRFSDRTLSRLNQVCAAALERLVDDGSESGSGRALLAELKADPGPVGLETLLREIDKLAAVRALGLPADLFADASEKLVDSWRARAARSYPSDLRAAAQPVRLTSNAPGRRARGAASDTSALIERDRVLADVRHRWNASSGGLPRMSWCPSHPGQGVQMTTDEFRFPGSESPSATSPTTEPAGCCSAQKQATCCDSSEKSTCCGSEATAGGGCGCQ